MTHYIEDKEFLRYYTARICELEDTFNRECAEGGVEFATNRLDAFLSNEHWVKSMGKIGDMRDEVLGAVK